MNWTIAPGPNAEPFTVRVKPGDPACAELGDRVVMTGEGAALIVKVRRLESKPPEFTTPTLALPGEAIREAGIVVLIWVEPTTVPARFVPLQKTLAPGQCRCP